MKAGIFTYHFSDNYGALFQAYALRKWLLDRGISAEFVNYHPAYVEEGGPLDRPWKASLWKKNATILYMRQAHLRRKLFGDSEQRKEFERFRSDYLGITGQRLFGPKELTPHLVDYDVLICGSDQIWNPSIQRGLDPVYFLDIPGAESVRKVAYAPSFGRSSIEPSHLKELNRLIEGLDAVSVRETSGLDILATAGLSKVQACVVPDPTILRGRFDELLGGDTLKDSIDRSVFCYALRTDEVIRDVAKAAANHFGAKLLAPRSSHQRWHDIGQGVIPGPIEWLRMLARAKIVVSNSFHGIALSIVLNRPFIAVALPGKRAGMNARAENLLKLAGLTDRLVKTADPNEVRRLAEAPIDWSATNKRLATTRSEAEAYLDAQIAALKERTS
jgi:hypothetical protein